MCGTDKIKKRLHSYRSLYNEVKQIKERLDEIESSQDLVKSVVITDMPKGSDVDKDSIGRLLARLEELRKEFNAKLDKMLCELHCIEKLIEGLEPTERQLMRKRYIEGRFNPWNEGHWLKRRFFDHKDNPSILAIITNYMCNEWLDDADKKVFEDMKKNNPKRYKVAGLGEWGIVDGLVYENWKEESFDINEISSKEGVISCFGIDFGYTNDPTALFCGLVDEKEHKIYVFDELYKKALTNKKIYDEILKMGYTKEKIRADCAEPKSIDELREFGLKGIRRSRKGKDSVNNGIQFIQGFEIIIHPKCVNFLREIGLYVWATDRLDSSKKLNQAVDDNNHLMDAMRYALEDIITKDSFSFE